MTTRGPEGTSFPSWEESILNTWYLLLYVNHISIVLITKNFKKVPQEIHLQKHVAKKTEKSNAMKDCQGKQDIG